jgi:hypothetical protein
MHEDQAKELDSGAGSARENLANSGSNNCAQSTPIEQIAQGYQDLIPCG